MRIAAASSCNLLLGSLPISLPHLRLSTSAFLISVPAEMLKYLSIISQHFNIKSLAAVFVDEVFEFERTLG